MKFWAKGLNDGHKDDLQGLDIFVIFRTMTRIIKIREYATTTNRLCARKKKKLEP